MLLRAALFPSEAAALHDAAAAEAAAARERARTAAAILRHMRNGGGGGGGERSLLELELAACVRFLPCPPPPAGWSRLAAAAAGKGIEGLRGELAAARYVLPEDGAGGASAAQLPARSRATLKPAACMLRGTSAPHCRKQVPALA